MANRRVFFLLMHCLPLTLPLGPGPADGVNRHPAKEAERDRGAESNVRRLGERQTDRGGHSAEKEQADQNG